MLKKEDESRKKWNNSRPPNKGGPRTRMAGKKYKPTYVEAGVQTYIEVSSIGKNDDFQVLIPLYVVQKFQFFKISHPEVSFFEVQHLLIYSKYIP